jgi:hypothetical protein
VCASADCVHVTCLCLRLLCSRNVFVCASADCVHVSKAFYLQCLIWCVFVTCLIPSVCVCVFAANCPPTMDKTCLLPYDFPDLTGELHEKVPR